MPNTQAIPWKRLSAETGAIVLSILLAFWIDAWWDDRNLRVEEHELLLGLEAEFVDLRTRLSFWEGFNRQGIDLIEQYLSDSVNEMGLESFELLFASAWLVNVLDVGGALDALLASGRLERISDRDIRVRLAKWPDWLEDMHTNDISVRNYAWGEIIPFLAKQGFPRKACPEGKFICTEPGPIDPDYIRLAGDAEFRSLLTIRRVMMAFAAEDLKNAGSEADEIVSLIRARLSEFGDIK